MVAELQQIMQNRGMKDVEIALAVSGISGRRTTLIAELTEKELMTLMSVYKPQKTQEIAQKRLEHLEMERVLKQKRAVVLKCAQTIGLYEPGDWSRFNRFMLKNSPFKKPLNQYKIDEFPQLIAQFKNMVTKYEQDAKLMYTKAWYHKNKLPMPSEN